MGKPRLATPAPPGWRRDPEGTSKNPYSTYCTMYGRIPMAKTIDRRVCAEMDGGFVVFLIGMRVNRPWKIWKWLPVAIAMPKMLIELANQPELGLLHAENQF